MFSVAEEAGREREGTHSGCKPWSLEGANAEMQLISHVPQTNSHEDKSMPDSNEIELYDIELQGLAEVSRTLLGQGADVNAKNKDALTPFFLASQSQYADDPRLKVLLDHGAIDSGDGSGESERTST